MKNNDSGEATVNMGNPDSIDLGVEIAKQVADGFDVPTELTVRGVPVARFNHREVKGSKQDIVENMLKNTRT